MEVSRIGGKERERIYREMAELKARPDFPNTWPEIVLGGWLDEIDEILNGHRWKYESDIQDENNILSKNLKEIDEILKDINVNCNEFVRLCEVYEYLTIKKGYDKWLTLYAIYKLGEINEQRKVED